MLKWISEEITCNDVDFMCRCMRGYLDFTAQWDELTGISGVHGYQIPTHNMDIWISQHNGTS